ncbi:MAG TPA: M14 family zinc carboxypeptidase [Patescibacteria group bacterium]|nr:M14 family zinc carboxypeptidase [Patescibacteria group bacterium]
MFQRLRASRRSMTLGATLATACIALTALTAAAADFPARDSRYHSFTEMVTDIRAVQTAHPDIVRLFSIGKSYQGRTIWAAKISDNVATDEAEPEILFDSLHHAREHMGVEQSLDLLHLLADGYGTDAAIRDLVDSREVYMIFALNPDGFEYDLTCGGSHAPYCAWRKNRQPNANTSAIGTDLNRNYGYRWACCGGSSGSPSSITFRGPRAWSAPETRAIRDFVLSRVIGGRQQIKSHITFHTNGQLILWPYGYTKTDVPTDMTSLDHAAFVAFANGMASRNGYRAEQSSDMYITDGDQIDWLYGTQRIFSFTWELYPPETATVWGDHYPADENIAAQTANNRSALLYFLSAGGCPYAVLGRTRTDCGPLFDDTEIARGWTVNPDGTDTAATTSRFARGDPAPTTQDGLRSQPDGVASGRSAFVTGLASGSTPNTYDLDGRTTIRSPVVRLPSVPGRLSLRYVYSHGPSSAADGVRVWIEDDQTKVRTVVWSAAGSAATVGAAWRTATATLDAWAGKSVRIVIQATDAGTDSLMEVLIDDIRVERPPA